MLLGFILWVMHNEWFMNIFCETMISWVLKYQIYMQAYIANIEDFVKMFLNKICNTTVCNIEIICDRQCLRIAIYMYDVVKLKL